MTKRGLLQKPHKNKIAIEVPEKAVLKGVEFVMFYLPEDITMFPYGNKNIEKDVTLWELFDAIILHLLPEHLSAYAKPVGCLTLFATCLF